jgi:4-hydroxy-tetrahydrodipicolinate reductase
MTNKKSLTSPVNSTTQAVAPLLTIALIGYGKMGKAIEAIALQKGHSIGLKIDADNADEFTAENLRSCDVAIEFTGPHSAIDNIKQCIDAGIPVISGSTGWLEKWDEVKGYCQQKNGALLYASNFSIGVNIFFEVNKKLAALMAAHTDYKVMVEEIHHTAKLDAPSGTAITLAEQIIQHNPGKNKWVNEHSEVENEIPIISKRIDPAPGTHYVRYSSAVDEIEIIHTANSRQGFASGAVLAAEFMKGKKGIYGMKDVLRF